MKSNIIRAATALLMLSSCSLPGQSTWLSFPDDASGEQGAQRGDEDAALATLAYSRGDFDSADKHLAQALAINPRNTQALMVGALMSEQQGRLNRARQYYEDLILSGGDRATTLGTESGAPENVAETARKRLRALTMRQNRIVTETDGVLAFDISKQAAEKQGRSAMEEALFAREQKMVAQNKSLGEADRKAVEVLFDDGGKNAVSRFLIMKELAEKDMITKEEFLSARAANIGALLPLTKPAPGVGLERPVPSPDVILERIDALKEAEQARAITPREFSAERNLIVQAVLPPHPRAKAKPKPPARDIMSAAKEMRKVEVVYDLGLVTAGEKDAEQKAIEKYLGLNKGNAEEPVSPPLSKGRPGGVLSADDGVVSATPAPLVSQPEETPAPAPADVGPKVVPIVSSVAEVAKPFGKAEEKNPADDTAPGTTADLRADLAEAYKSAKTPEKDKSEYCIGEDCAEARTPGVTKPF